MTAGRLMSMPFDQLSGTIGFAEISAPVVDVEHVEVTVLRAPA